MILAGVSSTTTVLCNESGQWIAYEADAHGFNNPRNIWDGRRIELVTLGDSYTHGYCSVPAETIVGLIRASGMETLNLGQHRTGPLRQLALFREYGERHKPDYIVWFYTELDFADLHAERDDPVLIKYLDPNFNAGLIDHQKIIDADLRRASDIRGRLEPDTGFAWAADLKNLVFLRTIRTMFGLNVSGQFYFRDDLEWQKKAMPTYAAILKDVRDAAEQWGGKVIMVYLPHKTRFLRNAKLTAPERLRDEVIALWRELNLDVIDLAPAFVAHPEPASLVFGPHSHYSEKGNQLVASAVLDGLNKLSRRSPSTLGSRLQ